MIAFYCLVALILEPGESYDYTDPFWDLPMKPINLTHRGRSPLSKTNVVIRFDLSPLDSSYGNPSTCYDGSGSVVFQNFTYTCAGNYLNESQKSTVNTTLTNVASYLNRLLLVDRIGSDIKFSASELDSKDFKFNDVTIGAEEDLVIKVYSAPHNETDVRLGAAASLGFCPNNARPILGLMFLNPRQVPAKDANNYFFWIALHETLHILGVDSDLYGYYHKPNSTVTYNSSFDVVCELQQSNTITRYFLVTPYAHAFAIRQYGTDTFSIGNQKCPSGIEIENLGGSGTALTHPKVATAYSDVMCGVMVQGRSDAEFIRLTTITAAFLLDTGNYEIDWSSQQVNELLWGYKETFLSGETPEGYPLGAKQNIFPEHYGWSAKYWNSFDFRFYSPSGRRNYRYNLSQLSSDSYFTNNQDYFNPKNQEKFGYDAADYVAHPPYLIYGCSSGKIALTLDSESGGAKCVSYQCNSNYTLVVGTQQVSVDNEGVYEVDGEKYIIPNGEYICRTMSHSSPLTSDPFSSVDFDYYTAWKKANGYSGNELLMVVIIGIVVAVAAVVVVCVFCVYRRRTVHNVDSRPLQTFSTYTS